MHLLQSLNNTGTKNIQNKKHKVRKYPKYRMSTGYKYLHEGCKNYLLLTISWLIKKIFSFKMYAIINQENEKKNISSNKHVIFKDIFLHSMHHLFTETFLLLYIRGLLKLFISDFVLDKKDITHA